MDCMSSLNTSTAMADGLARPTWAGCQVVAQESYHILQVFGNRKMKQHRRKRFRSGQVGRSPYRDAFQAHHGRLTSTGPNLTASDVGLPA
ncbi:MAG: hypothetical protein ACE5F6_05655 [Anaerolineae bacterium]